MTIEPISYLNGFKFYFILFYSRYCFALSTLNRTSNFEAIRNVKELTSFQKLSILLAEETYCARLEYILNV